jgi:hypothetical protein
MSSLLLYYFEVVKGGVIMLTPFKVTWQNLSSLDLDLWTELSFDSEQGAASTYLNREAVATEYHDGSYRRIHTYKYNEVLTPRITLIKQNYEDFTSEENRQILSWLTARQTADWLEIYHDDSNVVSYRLFGNFITVEQHKLSNGRVIGYECEFESSSPYAYSNKFIYPMVYETIEEGSINDETNDYLMISGTENFKITCNTDEYNKPIYPKVIIDFRNNMDIYTPINERLNDQDMIPNVVYKYGDGTLDIKISSNDVKVRAEVLEANVNDSLDVLYTQNSNGYFCVKDGRSYTIRQIVKQNNNYAWKTIAKTGAACKINTSYVSDGELIENSTYVKGAALDEVIMLDGMNKVISVIRYDEKGKKIDDGIRVIGDDFEWKWPSLVYGDNNITISGNCAVQIQWIEPRKVGNL